MDPKNEVAVEQTTAVARVDEPMNVQQLVAHVHLIETVMKQVMQKDVHYGVVPGTDKPTLLLPGAQKLALTFRFRPDFEERQVDLPNGHREYHFACRLCGPDGAYLGAGVSSCSTMEKKYRWRQAERVCPGCGKKTIIKGKKEYGGGWVCFAKKGGCGAKWNDGAKEIEDQVVGQVENPDLADTYNTVKKMAKKRAFVDAVLTVTGASDMFTQDVEDLVEIHPEPKVEAKPEPKTEPKRTKLQEARLGAVRALKTTTDAQEMAKSIAQWRTNAKLTDDEYNELMAEMEKVTEDKDVPF